MPRFKDLTGQTFDRLKVLKVDHKQQCGNRFRYYWLCECECGNTVVVRTDCLTKGLVKSCGCLKKEQDEINLRANHSHKLSHTKFWDTYYGMMSRCYESTDKRYSDYGGRGIGVCNEWREDKNKFFEWAKDNGLKEGLQLDRIDNNGDYSPDNCRWVTPKQNSRNRRSNVMVEFDGEWITLIEVAERLGISIWQARKRYRKFGIKRSELEARQRRGNQADCEQAV